MFLGLSAFTVAQSYDEVVMVDPDDYRIYETSFHPSEFGLGWKNYLRVTLIKNATCLFCVTNTSGYNQFINREKISLISYKNIIRYWAMDADYNYEDISWLINLDNEEGVNPIYVIIYNDDNITAIWDIKISTYSEYVIWWAWWWTPLIISLVVGGIAVVVIVKKIRKRN